MSFEFFDRLSSSVDIPIMIQDAPMSGANLTAPFLARMAREIEHVSYFKIEMPGTANKLRELIRLGGDAIEGPWDGEERSEEHTSELQSQLRISYAVFCLKQKTPTIKQYII